MVGLTPPKHPRDLGVTRLYDQSIALIAGGTVVITAANIAVVLRLLSRKIKRLNWAADDYLVVVAVIFANGAFYSLLFCIQAGLGRNDNSPASAKVASLWLYIFDILFPFATAITKLSILYLYKRVFSIDNRAFAYSLYTLGGIQAGWLVASFFTTVFQCRPMDTRWNPKIKGSHCIDFVSTLIALASINIACNAAILILPLPMIYRLQMSRKMKHALSAVFILGCGDVIVGIARAYVTSHAVNNAGTLLWRAAPGVMLSFVEPCLGIICTCLVVMRPLLLAISSIFSKILSSSSAASTSLSLNPIGGHDTSASVGNTLRGPEGDIGGIHPFYEPVRVAISAGTSVTGGAVFTNRTEGNLNPRFALRDEEERNGGIRVRFDFEQSATRR